MFRASSPRLLVRPYVACIVLAMSATGCYESHGASRFRLVDRVDASVGTSELDSGQRDARHGDPDSARPQRDGSAGFDAARDAFSFDASAEAGLDAQIDADVDAQIDADLDAQIDAQIDAGLDADLDLDAQVDAAPEGCALAEECDDGSYCNGVEQCLSSGLCSAGLPPAVTDNITCTVDACDEDQDAITHTPSDAACSDGASCNGVERCTPTGCSPGEPQADTDDDDDGDGFTVAQGDCAPCDPEVNPAAIEVPGNDKNDDCSQLSGMSCDVGLQLTNSDPSSGARALGLCQTTTASSSEPGVLRAAWVRANGIELSTPSTQYGLLPSFGPNVPALEGESMLVLSTGRARLPGHVDACGNHDCGHGPGVAPAGFPQPLTPCPFDAAIFDDIGFHVELRAPANATGFRVAFRFYTHEWAGWVCTLYNDHFTIRVSPAPDGSNQGNIAFGDGDFPVSVNSSYMRACNPDDSASFAVNAPDGPPPLPDPYCPLGLDSLLGTGFHSAYNSGGATPWLVAEAPVTPGSEVHVDFSIWDSADNNYDSTVLIDSFEWITDGSVVTKTGPSPL